MRRGKKRKGGVQQRLGQAQQELKQESAVFLLLMNLFAKGMISGVLAHKIAKATKEDLEAAREGKEFPDLEQLANLQEGKNVARSVHNTLAKTSSLPSPLKVEMPYSDGLSQAHVLLPHEYFAALYANEQAWRKCILSDPSSLSEFWNTMGSHPAVAQHPMKKTASWQTLYIPICMHGDEVPVQGVGKIWSRSALSFSWNSIIANALGAKGSDIMMYIWGVFERFCIASSGATMGTMDTFWAILTWSFKALFSGKFPSCDWRGVQYDRSSPEGQKANSWLAEGYRGVLIQLAGDLDYFTKWLGTPVSTNHAKPCCQCKCTFAGPLSWQDNRVESPWQSALLTNANWKTHWSPTCALFSLPGMNAFSIALDLMHNLYLGWLQHAYGSVFYLLTHECLAGDPLANLKRIGKFIKDFQKNQGGRYKYRQRLDKISMFKKKKGFPKLKGRAADIMGLDLALYECWVHFMDSTDEQHQLVALFLKLNLDISKLLDENSPKYGFFAVPLDEANTLVTLGLQMAQVHVQLCDFYKEQGRALWNLTSKTHFCLHTFKLARFIHPSLVWCFKGEANMKAVQQLWKSCLSGNKHWAVSKSAAYKFRHLMHLKRYND